MTVRRTVSLQRRLRERENSAVESARQLMSRTAERVAALPWDSSRPVRQQSGVVTVMADAFDEAVSIGVLLLRDAMQWNLDALGRDMLAVEATLGRKYDGLAAATFERLDAPATLTVFEEQLETVMENVFEKAFKEMERQQMWADRFDDDAKARIVSETPVRVIGRKGVGVVPSLQGAIHAAYVLVLYDMVNAQRRAVAVESQKVIKAVGR